MKKIVIYITLLMIPIGFSACQDDFLETAPASSIGTKQAEETVAGIASILEGMHYMMYGYTWGSDTHVFGLGQASIGANLDMLGDDLINTKPAYYMSSYRWNDNPDPYGGLNYKTWDFYYTMILHANKVVGSVNKMKSDKITEDEKNTLLGEAYAFRAWAYFNLVQLFGKRYVKGEANDQLGVIIRTEDQLQDQLPRSSVAEVYKYIDENMKLSLEHLKKAPDKEIKNAIRYSTACGLASRIALTKSEWKEAEFYANEAINKSGATLQSGKALTDGFNNMNATEWMWAYTQNPTQDFGYFSFFTNFSYNFEGYNRALRFAVNRSIFDKMGKKDIRRNWWVAKDLGDEIPKDANPAYFSGGMAAPKWEYTGQSIKFKARGSNQSHGDVQVMRLAEMYYNKAEAQARQGKYADAKNTLMEIMVTRDEEYTTTADGDMLVEEIMRNKRIDLWMEGRRFFDMKRLSIVPDRLSAANFQYLEGADLTSAKNRNTGEYAKFVPKTPEDKTWEFAIPYDEIKGNELCKQNPL